VKRALAFALLLLLAGCEKSPKGVVKQAEFGVFFGGQIQELKELPKQLDPARQRHGFRLTFAAPLERDVSVEWEVALPVTDKSAPAPALIGRATAKSGQTVLDVPLAFRSSDPLGQWHAKVTADGVVVIDRDFAVVAAK
jgi:hypothetical protein